MGSHSSLRGGGSERGDLCMDCRECNRVLPLKVTAEAEKSHGGLVSAAEERELNAWKTFEVFQLMNMRTPSKSIVDSRWAFT